MRKTVGMRRTPRSERVLATVLFTDIVRSTELAASLGDRRWRDLVALHHRVIRAQLKRFSGQEIDTAGDGFFAIFDRPAQALHCAVAIVGALRPLGLEVRVGLNTGEVEHTGNTVRGIAVHIGARVMATGGPSEIMVTSTVKDLVSGSDIGFVDRGMSTLKGIEGDWRLYAVITELVPLGDAAEAATAPKPGRQSRALVILGLAGLGVVVATAAILAPRLLTGQVVPGENTVGRIPAGGDSFDLAVRVGKEPVGLTSGAGALWVINFADQTLSGVDPVARAVMANPAIGGSPSGVTYGAGAIWVTTHFGRAGGDLGSVVRFDSRAIRVSTIPVGTGVEAIAFGGGFLWVADRIHDVVHRIDPDTNSVASTGIAVGRAPGAIAFGAGSVWVTSTLDDTVWRIDPVTSEVDGVMALQASPSALAANATAVWVTSETGDSVTRLDPATNTLVTILQDLDGPRGVAVSEDAVWVAVGGEGKLVRIDPETNTVAASYQVDGVPDAVLAGQDGGTWVSVRAP